MKKIDMDFYVYYSYGFSVFFRNILFLISNPFFIFYNTCNSEKQLILKKKINKDKSIVKKKIIIDTKHIAVRHLNLKNKWNFINKSFFFFIFDMLNIIPFSKFFTINNSINLKRIHVRLKQVKWFFYRDNYLINTSFFFGFKSLWLAIRFWFLGLILGLFAFYYLMYIRLLPFNKIIFEWVLVIMFLYWLLSGFVFFIKKYQYSKFTSVIQRFWKRSYILFWLIESGVFITFFYLTLNASEEPVYMYDQLKIYKSHLFSWRWFLIKLIPLSSLIIFGYFLQLNLKWNLFNKQSAILLLLTLILLYLLWLEFYQFFHVINFYGNLNWVFDYDEYLWNLEIEFRRTRLSNNYVAICLMAKFWHLVFIFVFWVFFILRINEIKRVRYPLLVANLQNFIILYIMSWLYMYPWLKFLFRPFLDISYYWFFLNIRKLGIRIFFNDIKLIYFSIFNLFTENLFFFKTGIFYYWLNSDIVVGFDQFKKHIIRDYFIYIINSTFNN